jgi:hypothetical protein
MYLIVTILAEKIKKKRDDFPILVGCIGHINRITWIIKNPAQRTIYSSRDHPILKWCTAAHPIAILQSEPSVWIGDRFTFAIWLRIC